MQRFVVNRGKSLDRAKEHPFRVPGLWRVPCKRRGTTSRLRPFRKQPAGAALMISGRDFLMIQQSTPTEQAGAKDLSAQEAFVALLIASARADGSVSAHEANRIEHVVAGMKLFRGYSHERLQKVFTAAAERIKEHGAASVVQAAAAIAPKELGATTFAVAIDLMLSDGRLSPKEEGFADELRTLLNVERETAATIVDVLLIKNAG